jgi:hypothetical protein
MQKMSLKKSEQPDVFFFQTINETNNKGVPRARLLENQWIPCADGEFALADTELNVESDHKLRKMNPIGTFFYCTNISFVEIPNRKSYYRTAGDVGLVTSNPDINKLFNDFQKSGKTPRRKKALKDSEEMNDFSAAGNSKIGHLLSKFPVPTPEQDGYYIEPKKWARILVAVDRKRHILLTGSTSTGKTKLANIVGKKHGKPVVRINFAAKQDAITTLFGSHRHDPVRGSYFDPAPFLESIQKPGFIILDEVNRAPSAATNILFPILEGEKTIQIDQALSTQERTVNIHPEMLMIATANEGNEYNGTFQMDPAFKRRLSVIPIDHISMEEECRILSQRTKAKKSDIKTIVEFANSLRKRHEDSELSYCPGMSLTLEAAELCEDGFPLMDALQMTFLSYFPKDESELVKDEMSAL